MITRLVQFAIFILLITMPARQLFADTFRSRVQIALNNVQIAMGLHAEDHDGRLPTTWADFSPYLEQDAVEEFSKMIKLLTMPGAEVHIDGKRLLAISRSPRADGVFEAIQEPAKIRVIAGITEEQLREAGLDPSSIDSPSESPPSSALEEKREDKATSDGVSKRLPPDRESKAAGETDKRKSLLGVLSSILIVLLVAVAIRNFRRHNRRGNE